ncbi:MAG: deoxyribose-phosphate aldolase [Bacillota bacterium]
MVDLSKLDKKSIGKCFDLACLPKNTTEAVVRAGAKDAIAYNTNVFQVSSPFWLPVVLEELEGTDIKPSCCIAFPFGSTTPYAKAKETEQAVQMGAKSLDMAMNIGALMSGDYKSVEQELKDFVTAAQGVDTKVIIDVAFLKDDEIAAATRMIVEAGVNYAKTATGQFEGPTMEQFLIMRDICEGTATKTKVSGVKFPRPQNAYNFLIAGADLIGTRAAPEIIDALPTMRKIGLVPPYKP